MPEITGTFKPPRLATAPGAPVNGQMYFNTTDNKLYYWNGTAWVSLSPSGGGGGQVSQTYTVTAGYTVDRAFNPEATSLTEVARLLGTLIDDMKAAGLITP